LPSSRKKCCCRRKKMILWLELPEEEDEDLKDFG
jgi:hypothetical protein